MSTALESHYQREGEDYLVELRVTALDQLLDSLDPAPFRKRTLVPEAEDYIIACARDLPRRQLKLVLYLPEELSGKINATALSGTVKNHFAYRAESSRRLLRQVLRNGGVSLLIGLTFLITCVGLRELLGPRPPSWMGRILKEGLLVCGWVAMWRPIQVFLYDWWPLLGDCRLFRRLEGSETQIRPVPPAALVRTTPVNVQDPLAGHQRRH